MNKQDALNELRKENTALRSVIADAHALLDAAGIGEPAHNLAGRVAALIERAKEGMVNIKLIDHYTEPPTKIAKDLDALVALLGEREAEVYRCTCDDDPERPRGHMEYDTNAYIHADDCPSGLMYHHQVLLLGLARHFREDM